MPVPPGQPVMECTIELRDVTPRAWRRLLVPASVRLRKLHGMVQAAMGWEDCHLHSFDIGEDRYGMQFDDYPEGELDEQSVTVLRAVGAQERFGYEYDFGDSWEHEISVTSISRSGLYRTGAVTRAGYGSCHSIRHGRPVQPAMGSRAAARSTKPLLATAPGCQIRERPNATPYGWRP